MCIWFSKAAVCYFWTAVFLYKKEDTEDSVPSSGELKFYEKLSWQKELLRQEQVLC